MAEPLRAVDANVFLRYLLQDVPEQATQARRLIDSERPLALTAVTLAEVAGRLPAHATGATDPWSPDN